MKAVLALALAVYFVAGIGYLALRWYVWPRLDDWRPRIEASLARLAGAPVRIGTIRTGFDGLAPSLEVSGLHIDGPDGVPLLAVRDARAVLSMRTLWAGEPRLAELRLEGVDVTVIRDVDGSVVVGGVALRTEGAPDREGALDALMAQRRLVAQGASVRWIDRAAGADERIDGVDLSIGNVGRRHRISLVIAALQSARSDARAIARDLRAGIEFYRPVNSRPSAWRTWEGEAYLSAEWVDVAHAVAMLVPGAPLERGQGALRVWSRFDAGRVLDALVKVSGEDVRTRAPWPITAWSSVALEASVAPANADGWDVRLSNVTLVESGGLRLAGRGEQRLTLDTGLLPRSGRLALEDVDAAGMLALARAMPLSASVQQWLARLTTTGRLRGTELAFTHAGGLEFDASLQFDALSARVAQPGPPPVLANGRPAPRVPGFSNLSGSARLTHEQGEVDLDAKNALLIFPGVFEQEAIGFDALQARVEWSLGAPAASRRPLSVRVPRLAFANADAAGSASGQWRSGGKGHGVLELDGRLDRAQASRTHRYLPLQLPPEVRRWVRTAVTAGSSNDVRVKLRGDLEDFPFEDPAAGHFEITATVGGGTLAYAPGWPAIDRFEGRLAFVRNGMAIDMASGRMLGVTLAETQARLPDYRKAMLTVEGGAQGPARDMLRVLGESPLASRVGEAMRDASVDGDVRLALRLDLPVGEPGDARVAGTVTLAGNEVRVDRAAPPLKGASGRIEFTDRGVALRQVSATFLGGPLRLDGETQDNGRFALRANGSVSADALRTLLDNGLTRKLSGRTDYSAQVDVHDRVWTVRIASDLAGLASALPAPFEKAADVRWPMRVVVEPQRAAGAVGGGDRIGITLREHVRIALERERDASGEKLLIRRGAFAIGGEPVLPAAGLAVIVHDREIDLDAWRALLASVSAPETGARAGTDGGTSGAPSSAAAADESRTDAARTDAARTPEAAPAERFAEGFSLMPSVVSIVGDRVRIAGKDLHEVVFGASRFGGFWRANIAAREINGFFNWREAAPGQPIGTLTARFARLEIPPSQRGAFESLLEDSPQVLPALDIVAQEFVLGERSLGTLRLVAANEGTAGAPVWNVRELRIAHPGAVLSATGAWSSAGTAAAAATATASRAPGGASPDAARSATAPGAPARTTRLDFTLELTDPGAVLDTFGMHHVLQGAAGTLAGRIAWAGSPLSIHYPSLDGQLHTALGPGQFLKTEPGIAKLIGVLNLQSLPRRLNLDFRDVFAEGFAFDRIEGDVRIARGVARTDDLAMRGLQALVRIRGEADLDRETQAIEIEVRPELNAGLASLAYAALANPALGLGSFLAQLVLRRPLQELFTYEYDVSGSWTDPQVVEKRRYARAPAAETTQ